MQPRLVGVGEAGLWRAALPVGKGEGMPVACSLTWLERERQACGEQPHLVGEGEAGLWRAASRGWRAKLGLWLAASPVGEGKKACGVQPCLVGERRQAYGVQSPPHLVGERGPGLWRAASPNWIRGVRTIVRSLTWLKRRRQTYGMQPHLVEEGVPGPLHAASPG